jgi:hypothetical protein
MFPWLWFFAPRIQLPYSGPLSQTVEPNTSWFFGGIPASAADGEMERRAFNVASYGRQLGLITEVLLGSIGNDTVAPEQARESLARLKEIYLGSVPSPTRIPRFRQATAVLEKLRTADPARLAQVLERFAPPAAPSLPFVTAAAALTRGVRSCAVSIERTPTSGASRSPTPSSTQSATSSSAREIARPADGARARGLGQANDQANACYGGIGA